ncbi:MAG TPA: hypothetical protein VFC85_03950 [Verrucomicrobiae bacterium]|nr:hypothetical protein [Verrucomicrobiae bacterium]
MKLIHFTFSVLTFAATILLAAQARAAFETFTIDTSQSQISLSGTIAGFTLVPQGSGSLTNSYTGSIKALVSGSTIQFTGSSAITATTNGSWQPALGGVNGSAAGNYGGQISIYGIYTGYGAARNIILDLTSPSLALSGTNFDSSALVFSFALYSGAEFDYNTPFGSGYTPLVGNSTNTVANGASLSNDGATQKLLIQFNTPFVFSLLSANDTTLILKGQIVATNSLVIAPFSINSFMLTNNNAVLKVQNATLQSQLQSSTNLAAWKTVTATTTSNAGAITFTAPISGSKMFFRVQK